VHVLAVGADRFQPRGQVLALRRRIQQLHAHVGRVAALDVVVGRARQRAIVGHAMRQAQRIARGVQRLVAGIEQRQLHRLHRHPLRLPVLRDEQRHWMTAERGPRGLEQDRRRQIAFGQRQRCGQHLAVANQT
jgi:hypothetical protein